MASAQEALGAADAALHGRLLARDPIAPYELVVTHLRPLIAYLTRRYPNADPHVVESCADDALLDLAQHPERYDPARSTLRGYLQMAAHRDLLNEFQRETRRRKLVKIVELDDYARNIRDESDSDPAQVVARPEPLSAEFRGLLNATFDRAELQVVDLMVEGERRTSVYAALLGLGNLSETEQARAVKQVKDRLQKRLRRLAARVPRADA